MRRENLSSRHIKPILRRAGLPASTRIYVLRRTFASLWMESGEDAMTLQGILGHARITTTMERYVRPSDRTRREAMGRFGAGFAGS
jgi:site-specific recombinase XerD